MKTPRVVFVNTCSPFLLDDRGAPPLGLLTLAAEVRAAGYDVACIDLTANTRAAKQLGCSAATFMNHGAMWVPEIMPGLQAERDIIALSVTSAQYESARNLLFALKWECGNVPVIIGGPHASALPNECLRDGFTTVFTGEADAALVDWLNVGMPEGLIVHSKAPRDLDGLPFPARDLVDLASYCANLTVGQGLSTTIHSSRGCPFSCQYCVRTLGDLARVLRVRSIDQVWAEVLALADQYGIRRFVATDDIWGIKRTWVEDFCQRFRSDDAYFHFRVNCRANTLHYDLLPAMKSAGIDCISFGFESGDERVLSAISKNSVETNTRAVHACHDAGIAVKAYLIWGFASDDEASVHATMQWIEQARPDSAQCAWLVPLPGTPIYEDAVAQGWEADYSTLYHNGRDYRGGMSRLPWHTDKTAEQYEDLCEWLEGFYRETQPPVQCPNALTT